MLTHLRKKKRLVERIGNAQYIDCRDAKALADILRRYRIETPYHLATLLNTHESRLLAF